jgi:ribosomal protein S18 acetylase RimI-like enzyme
LGFSKGDYRPRQNQDDTIMTLTIAPGRIEDTTTAARLLADTMAGFGVAVLGAGDEQLELKALQRWYGEKDNRFSHRLLLCFPGREVPGLTKGCARSILSIYRFGQLVKLTWRGLVLGRAKEAEKDEFLISHIAVFESYRRKGIARALLDKAVLCAREAGLSRVVLEVEIGNTAAIQLYEGYGFKTQFTTDFGRHKHVLNCPGYHKMVFEF